MRPCQCPLALASIEGVTVSSAGRVPAIDQAISSTIDVYAWVRRYSRYIAHHEAAACARLPSRPISWSAIVKKDTEAQFDAEFAVHAKNVERRSQIQAEQESKEDAFVRAFKERRTSFIKPALEEIAQYLQTKGMKTRIDEIDESHSRDVREQQRTAITIRFLTGDEKSHYADHEQPNVSFVCSKSEQLVRFLVSTISLGSGGHSGDTGSAKLELLTDELIQQKVLAVVREVLKTWQIGD
jgi:ATPase subunit of ABC transporter with duplicated ATPase domains